MATKYITLTNLGTFLGQLKETYKATDSDFGGIKLGYQENGQNYPVQLGTTVDDKGKAYVHVPWELGTFVLEAATNSALGGIMIGYNNGYADADATTYKAPLLLGGGTNNPNIGKAYVNLSAASTDNAGLMSAVDKTKLNNIDSYANNYILPNATSSTKGGVKIGANISVNSGTISLSKSDVINALGYSPAEENTSSGGGMVEKKWQQLVTLKEANQLSPGTKYRITDYATTIGAGAESFGQVVGGIKFDIIVEALTTNTLSENAKACQQANNSYFNNCNLDAWELKYCIDNNNTRFNWADTKNGKGVIYYMKDEWGNEAPYDFKSIKVFLDKVSTTTNVYKFTFTDSNDGSDLSLTSKAKNNVIKPWRSYKETNEIYYFNQISLSGDAIEDNYFDYNCSKISVFGQSLVLANKFNDSCDSILIYGNTIVHNTFGNDCADMSLNYDSRTNEISEISYNTFGNNCRYITASNNFRSNTFGNNCNNFIVDKDFMKNVIGNNCSKWLFGHHCMKNTIVSNNYFAHLDPDYNNPVVPDYNVGISDHRNGAYKENSSTFASIYYCESTNASTMIPLCYVCNCVFDQNSHVRIRLQNSFIDDMDDMNTSTALSAVLRNYIFINLNNGFFDNSDDGQYVVDPAEVKILDWYAGVDGDVPNDTGTYHCPTLNEPEITYVGLNKDGKIVKIPSSKLFGYFIK